MPLHRRFAAVLLIVCAAVPLTACGQQHAAAGAAGPGPSRSGASPYAEPGSHDGAPHFNDNHAGRLPRAVSSAHKDDAQEQADRIEPALKRLWRQKKWEPGSVRSAMLALGYPEQEAGGHVDGRIEVRAMDQRFKTDHYITPEGARIGLRVHEDACVTAFIQRTNYQVSVNGPYPETGCFEPPFAH